MFTGIVQTLGTVTSVTPKGGDVELRISAPNLDLKTTLLGDSIACSGCCLTVTKLDGDGFYADVSRESLNVTTLNAWQVGTLVNLEKALRAGDALGGHYVTGHVDGVGKVVALREEARSLRVEFSIPKSLGRYVAKKGSICVDGVSLTVNGVSDQGDSTLFDVNLIPHTRDQTILKGYVVGTPVNIEIDIIARYLERMQGVGPGA
jgi:riboflavin synthase